ncbi:MAG: TonB family protein [Pseudomonadota bacterium]
MSTQDLFKKRRFEGYGFYAIGLLGAVGLHAAVSYGATQMPPPKKIVRVEMAVVKTEKPPPPPEEKPPEPEKPKPKPKVEPKVALRTPPPPNQPPPPNSDVPPSDKPQKPVPIVTGISLGSTVSSGVGMAVRVGNTLYGDVNKEEFVQPGAVQPYVYTPVKTYDITEEPEVLKEVKAEMPEEAKRAGVQGTVVLRVEVQKDGAVRKVRVVKGLGYGLDEAAVAAMKKFTFKPAKINGQPVDYTISRFYYVFELVS